MSQNQTKTEKPVNFFVKTTQQEKQWFVFYTAPRAEKVVMRELEQRGYNVYLPLIKTHKVWKNRQKKTIEEVLFPSYIFVFTTQSKLHSIKQTSKIMTFIHCGGKPSIINNEAINAIKKMLDLNLDICVESNLKEGQRVRIASGPMDGYEGILVTKNSKTKFGIEIDEISQVVFVDINSSVVETCQKVI